MDGASAPLIPRLVDKWASILLVFIYTANHSHVCTSKVHDGIIPGVCPSPTLYFVSTCTVLIPPNQQLL